MVEPATPNTLRDDPLLSAAVARFMATDVLTCRPDQVVCKVARSMSDRRVGAIVALDERHSIAGIFTERDLLLRVVAPGLDPARARVGDVMTWGVETVESTAPSERVWELFDERGFRHVPVTASGKLVGLVSMRDMHRLRLRRIQALLDEEARALLQAHEMLTLSSDERTQELLKVNQRLEELALTDELTGLYNHRYFMRQLHAEHSRAQRHRSSLCLIFIDVDHFKVVNDRYGHMMGDDVLRHVSGLLRNVVEGSRVVARLRKSDIVARYGGEEFAVLLPVTAASGGAVVAERLRSLVAASALATNGHDVTVTISLGVAAFPEHARDPDNLLRVADEALYRAKAGGRNRVELAVATPSDAS